MGSKGLKQELSSFACNTQHVRTHFAWLTLWAQLNVRPCREDRHFQRVNLANTYMSMAVEGGNIKCLLTNAFKSHNHHKLIIYGIASVQRISQHSMDEHSHKNTLHTFDLDNIDTAERMDQEQPANPDHEPTERTLTKWQQLVLGTGTEMEGA